MREGFEYISDSSTHRYEGVTILRVVLRRPIVGSSEIDDFYDKLFESVKAFAEERLFPALCEEYRTDPDPHRRFVFGYICRFDCRVTKCDGERVEISSELDLSRKSSVDKIICQKIKYTFRISDGCILPPKICAIVVDEARKL